MSEMEDFQYHRAVIDLLEKIEQHLSPAPSEAKVECVLHEEVVRGGPSKWYCETHPEPAKVETHICEFCNREFEEEALRFAGVTQPDPPEPAAPDLDPYDLESVARFRQRTQPEPAVPEMPTNPVESANFNQNRGYSAAPEMPEAVRNACQKLRHEAAVTRNVRGDNPPGLAYSMEWTAERLESWWRNLAQPVAMGMTPAMEEALDWLEMLARGREQDGPAWRKTVADVRAAIAAVRQQAAQVKQ